MKLNRQVLLSTLVVATVFCVVLFASCVNECKNVTCLNGGTCNGGKCTCPIAYTGANCETKNPCSNGGTYTDGTCHCPPGYSGIYCDTAVRDKYLGGWAVFEQGNSTPPDQYPVTIKAVYNNVTGPVNVEIIDFWHFANTTVKAYISGDSIFIPLQVYEGKKLIGRGQYYMTGLQPRIRLGYQLRDTVTNAVFDYGYDTATYHTQLSDWVKD